MDDIHNRKRSANTTKIPQLLLHFKHCRKNYQLSFSINTYRRHTKSQEHSKRETHQPIFEK